MLFWGWMLSLSAVNKDVEVAVDVVNDYYTNLAKYMIDVEGNLDATYDIIDHCVCDSMVEVQNDFRDYAVSDSAARLGVVTYFTLIDDVANPDGEIKEQLRMDYKILKTELIETPVYHKKEERPYNYISILVEKKIYSKRFPKGKLYREQAKYDVDLGRIISIRPEFFDNVEHEVKVTKDVSRLRLFADEFYSRKKYDLAYRAYRRIVEIENGDKDAYYRIALMLLKHQGDNGLTSKQKDEEALICLGLAIKTVCPGCILPMYYDYDRKKDGFRVRLFESYRSFISGYHYYNRDLDARIALILFNLLEVENSNLQSMVNYSLNIRRACNVGKDGFYMQGYREHFWTAIFLNQSYSRAKEHYLKVVESKNQLIPHKKEEQKWGYVNSSSEIVIPCQFDYAGEFNEGLAPVAIGKNYGYINDKGILVIDTAYIDASVFSHRRAAVKVGYGYGYITPSGLMAIPPIYRAATPFFRPLGEDDAWAVVVSAENEIMKINTKGEAIARYILVNKEEEYSDGDRKAYWEYIK